MALRPDSIKPIKELEAKIDGMLLSEEAIDEDGKIFEFCLPCNEIEKDIQAVLTAKYQEAGWRRAFFKADNRTFVLNRAK